MNKITLKYWYKFILFFQSWRVVKFETPFTALWVFSKAVFTGVLFDLFIDLAKNSYEIFTNIKSEVIAMPENSSYFDVFLSSLDPTWAIDWPFYIIAFAAGRMATKMGDIFSYLVSWIILYISITNMTDQTAPLIILMIGIYGFGAKYSSLRKKSSDAKITQGINAKGSFRFKIHLANSKAADAELQTLRNFFARMEYCDMTSESVIKEKNKTKPASDFFVEGIIVGNKYYLPLAQDALYSMYSENGLTNVTEIIDMGGEYN